jgi:AcrR family transcriptional regulator
MDKKQRLEDIYRSALEEFAEYGFTRANLTGIARRLDMTKGNLYFFINSKKELYRDSIAWGLSNWQKNVFKEVEAVQDVKNQFITLCRASYHYLAEDPVLRTLLIKDPSLFPIDPLNGDIFSEIHNNSITMIGSILDKGRVQGVFIEDFDTDRISHLIYSIYVMFIVKTYILANNHSFEDYFNDAVELILRGVLKK